MKKSFWKLWDIHGWQDGPGPVTRKNAAVRNMLSQLHSRKNQEEMYQAYQKKKRKIMGSVMILGLVSAISLHLSSRMEMKLVDGAQIIRNEWGAGDYKIILQAKAGEWVRKITFPVSERQYTVQEKELLMEELLRALPDLIKGSNSDLQSVEQNLTLVSSVKGYPFSISWDSSNKERIAVTGKISREKIPAQGEEVALRAVIRDKQQEVTDTFECSVLVLPEILEEEEKFFRSLESDLIEKEEAGNRQKELRLPVNFEGKEVAWKEQKADAGIYVFLLFLLISMLLGRGMDQDLKKSIQKRNKQLMAEYAGFVSMLRLYLMAGLTVKNAFARITADLAGQKRSAGKQYLYEELKTACYQMENGMAQEQVYQEWGKRCGDMRYRRLSFLLGVHLKQGNSQLLQLLAGEVESAREDRRNYAKKAGEEASTKLLLPMMMMLMVVMMLVLLPAYLDFGNI